MKIIGLSGKKQSGKNTVANIISGIALKKIDLINDFELDNNGKLLIHCAEGVGELDLYRKDAEFVDYAHRFIWPYVKIYSFADDLKKMCVDLFEIPEECVYGTDDEKNRIQEHLLWENMPGILADKTNLNFIEEHLYWLGMEYHNPGPMTAREFMQFLGTDIMRKMFSPIWVNSTINRIKKEKSEVALIADVRFPNEADAIFNSGGINIRLHRDTNIDRHSSELALDNYENFDYHVDNNSWPLSGLMQSIMSLNLI